MLPAFEFATATRIVFGRGTFATTGKIAGELGRSAFVVTGRSGRHRDALTNQLRAAGVSVSAWPIGHEPTTDDIVAATRAARDANADVVIGAGGGSVIDAAKAVSALLTNDGQLECYLEVIGEARPLERLAAPYIAVPTTAGTGAEVTRNAVLASPRHRVKVSLRSPLMLPRVAVIDPALTDDLPPDLTATTGLDALTQLVEPYVSSRANPLVDGICLEGLRRVGRSLRRAFENGRDADARDDLAFGSLCGGLALANAGLGAVHGFAGPIGGAFPAPHGAVCAALLPHVTAANVRALRERSPGAEALRRYDELARLLTGRPDAQADDVVAWLRTLVRALKIPGLSAYGMSTADLPVIVAAAAKASSMKANPLPLTSEEAAAILSAAL